MGNYKTDPLYMYMDNLSESMNNNLLRRFAAWIKGKIRNRTLKKEDYDLFFDFNRMGERVVNIESINDRCQRIQKDYWDIGIDISISALIYHNNSNWELNWYAWGENIYLSFSKDKWLKESLEYLENKLETCQKLNEQWACSLDIWLYLINSNYIEVIDIKKDLWEFGDFNYLKSNKKHIFWTSPDSSRIIAKWQTLQELIDNFVSKKWIFDQKDKIKNINLYKREKDYKEPVQKMQFIISEFERYEYLYNFWLWKNNASAWFSKPSSAYGLCFMNTFGQSEYEDSAKLLIQIMSQKWNEWEIKKSEIGSSWIVDNLLKCWAVVVKDNIVTFTKGAIKKIEQKYNEQKEKSLRSINNLEKFFRDNEITLPE